MYVYVPCMSARLYVSMRVGLLCMYAHRCCTHVMVDCIIEGPVAFEISNTVGRLPISATSTEAVANLAKHTPMSR